MSEEWKPVERVLPANQGEGSEHKGGGIPADVAGGWQNVPTASQAYSGPPPMSSAQPVGSYGPTNAGPGYGAVAPQKKSHAVRNVLLILLTLFLLVVVGCGALLYKGLGVLRDSKPTRLAVQTAEASPFVRQKIGTPLKPSVWVTGSVNTSMDGGVKAGSANLKVNVTGPRGEGTLLANETLSEDGWKIVSLSYSDGSGTTPLVENGLPAADGAPHEETF